MPLKDALPPSEQAAADYNTAWRLCFGAFKGKGERSAIEKARVLFRQAADAFESRGESVALAKAYSGLSLAAGLLCNGEESLSANLRSVELLDEIARNAGKADPADSVWLVKGLRGLAESAPTHEERLGYATRGLALLPKLVKAKPDSWLKYYEALLNRASGSAVARLRPRTDAALASSEKHFRKAISLFEKIEDSEKNLVSHGKSYRELSRTLRAMAGGARLKGKTADSARHLKSAEAAARKAIELYQEAEDSSEWNHFHLAKILRDMGKPRLALAECLEAVKLLEEGRKKVTEDDNRISYLMDKLAVYDLGVCLADELDLCETGFDLSQRCKARVFLERFREKMPVRPSRDFGTIPDHRDLRKFLKADEGLIEYHLGRHAVSIFVLTAGGLKSARVPRSRLEVERMVRNFQGFIQQTPTEMTAALADMGLKELTAILVEPVAAHVASCRRLYVVPSGDLSYLPFAALPLPDGKRFIERWEASYLPSASMLPQFVSRGTGSRDRKLLAVANPTGELWDAEDEAREVAATFPASAVAVGAEATKKALADVGGATHVHIACHGQYSSDESLGSYLVLAPSADDDGILGVGEILDLPLNGVDLAFLSCCKSAHGRHKGGDEFAGVHRAFLFAGARAVVVTLWDIEDAITRKLVVSFYGHLKAGLPKSEALHRAKLEVLKRQPHPFYWAAFKLVGDPV